ncbi:S-layer homology domain-containing protein [Egicoccus sp. AB-alg2]|uniref:S-layer homology domain-containing protein n=1 Tax=Egicoccus sp. AB-alg2 TaxID=3242693 RepID=UPI00359DB48F
MTFATPPHLGLPDPAPAPVTYSRQLPTRRLRAAVLATLVILSSVTAAVTAPPAADASTQTPVMQRDRVSAAQIAAWFRASQPTGSAYRATVSPETLAQLFIEEGRAEGVAGDIAFAQSVLETGWFRWPSHGQVHATYNNFSGIGACDGGTCTVARFRNARIGVRAQIQHLRAYADPNVTVARLAHPLESPRFHLVSPKGKARLWEQMGNGNWATDPQYATKILSIHRSMIVHAERNGGVAAPREAVAKPAARFTDVPLHHAHRTGIERLADRGVVRGCTTTAYCPTAGVTRAQLATILSKALDLPPAANRFRDVSGTHAAGVGALTAAGITKGCAPNRFCPDQKVTREQLASMLQRGLKLPAATPPFRDVQRSVHRDAIGAVSKAGIASGFPDNTFRPRDVVNRGQVATLVDNATS